MLYRVLIGFDGTYQRGLVNIHRGFKKQKEEDEKQQGDTRVLAIAAPEHSQRNLSDNFSYVSSFSYKIQCIKFG